MVAQAARLANATRAMIARIMEVLPLTGIPSVVAGVDWPDFGRNLSLR
jgi:hypothetical protein